LEAFFRLLWQLAPASEAALDRLKRQLLTPLPNLHSPDKSFVRPGRIFQD